jgi:hypothetical protein
MSAVCLKSLGEYAGARLAVDEALKLNESGLEAMKLKALLCIEGDPQAEGGAVATMEEGLATIQVLLADPSHDAGCLAIRAFYYLKSHQADKAVRLYLGSIMNTLVIVCTITNIRVP